MIVVIAGTSGVGKSHLERELVDKHGLNQPIKYTDRLIRSTETQGQGIVCISSDEFKALNSAGEFFFTLDYMGHSYGWKKDDLRSDVNNVIAVTIEAFVRYIKTHPNSSDTLPIFLQIMPEDYSLLKTRMLTRSNYDTASTDEKIKIDQEVSTRMQLVIDEQPAADDAAKLAGQKGGASFNIKDDSTLYQQVLPFILDKLK